MGPNTVRSRATIAQPRRAHAFGPTNDLSFGCDRPLFQIYNSWRIFLSHISENRRGGFLAPQRLQNLFALSVAGYSLPRIRLGVVCHKATTVPCDCCKDFSYNSIFLASSLTVAVLFLETLDHFVAPNIAWVTNPEDTVLGADHVFGTQLSAFNHSGIVSV